MMRFTSATDYVIEVGLGQVVTFANGEVTVEDAIGKKLLAYILTRPELGIVLDDPDFQPVDYEENLRVHNPVDIPDGAFLVWDQAGHVVNDGTPAVIAEAQASAQAAAASAAAAEAVGATNDAIMAGVVEDTGSDTRAALNGVFVAKGDLVFNVKDFGAIGDGMSDDTDAIHAAIIAATGTPGGAPVPQRRAQGRVYLPPGTYRVSSALSVVSVIGFVMQGAGREQTAISFDVNLPGDALSLIGCPDARLSDFKIIGQQGYSTVVDGSALALDWTPDQAASWGSKVTIERVKVENLKFKYGFGIGANSANYDVSDVHLIDCSASGNRVVPTADGTAADDPDYWQAGFHSGSGVHANVLNHYYEHCQATFVRWLIEVDHVYSVDTLWCNGSHLDAALRQKGLGNLSWRGSRIEEARRLFKGEGGSSSPSNMIVEDTFFSPGTNGASDRMYIQWWWSGSFQIRQLWFADDAANSGDDVLIQFSNSSQADRQTIVTIDGIVCPNATFESLLSIPPGTKCYVDARGLRSYVVSTGGRGWVGRKVLVYNGAVGDPDHPVATGTVDLVAGTADVADASITANSIIRLSSETLGGTPGALYVSAKTAGTGFTITSTSSADTSKVYFEVLSY